MTENTNQTTYTNASELALLLVVMDFNKTTKCGLGCTICCATKNFQKAHCHHMACELLEGE